MSCLNYLYSYELPILLLVYLKFLPMNYAMTQMYIMYTYTTYQYVLLVSYLQATSLNINMASPYI